MADAVAMGGPVAVLTLAFLAVGREGGSRPRCSWSGMPRTLPAVLTPLIGLLSGIAVAAALTVLLYFGAIRINFAVFFRYTGAFLVIVAAGILAYGVRALQTAGWVAGPQFCCLRCEWSFFHPFELVWCGLAGHLQFPTGPPHGAPGSRLGGICRRCVDTVSASSSVASQSGSSVSTLSFRDGGTGLRVEVIRRPRPAPCFFQRRPSTDAGWSRFRERFVGAVFSSGGRCRKAGPALCKSWCDCFRRVQATRGSSHGRAPVLGWNRSAAPCLSASVQEKSAIVSPWR